MNNPPEPLAKRDLQLTRLYYLLFFGGNGFVSPFLSLFYVHQGLSGTQIGTVTSIGAFVTLLAAPFWAQKNASWHNPRGVLQLFVVLAALGQLWMSQQVLFAGIAIVAVFRALASAGIAPLSDSLAVSITGGNRAGFGSVRVFGSLGWVIFVMMSGWVAEHTGLQNTLIGAGLITMVGALVLAPIQASNFHTRRPKDSLADGFKPTIRRLLHNPPMLGIAGMLIVTYLANSGVSQFEGVFLRQLGARDTIIALASTVGAIVELPCMFWADRLTRKRGAYRVLLIAMIGTALLRGLVFVYPSIITIIAARAMYGIPFSFYTVALIQAVVQYTAEHEKRTVLALYTVTLTSLMGIVGAPIAGVAFDHLGARWLYAICAAGYVLAWLCLRVTTPPDVTAEQDA